MIVYSQGLVCCSESRFLGDAARTPLNLMSKCEDIMGYLLLCIILGSVA